MTPAMVDAVRRIGRLADDEAELRAQGRCLELNPARGEDAARLFRLADRLRGQRVELLDRCGLTR